MSLQRISHGWRNVRKIKRDLKHRVVKLPWMDVQPQDRFMFSYPRSGNTWLRHVVHTAINGSDVGDMERLEDSSPTIDALEFGERLQRMPPGMRFFKSHLPFYPEFLKGKVIYIVRDGRDATLSYYDYFRHIHRYTGSFDDFLRKSLSGLTMRYGSWRDNVGSWIEHADHPNVLVIRYEDMRADQAETARKVFDFCEVEVSPARFAEALASSSVDKVHATLRSWNSAQGTQFTGGASGGGKKNWRTRLTPEQNRFFVEHSGALLEKLGYELE